MAGTTHLNPLFDADYIVYGVGFAVNDSEPLEFALSSVKHSIENVLAQFPDRKYHRIFLSGKDNFRDKIATLQVYKGNRDPSKRPYYYDDIRDYLINVQGAETVSGMEAEDACGIEQYAAKDRDTAIVAVDKDLMTVPGWHYHPKKETLSYVNLAAANTFFWKQVLTGDRTDNIQGIEGMGPKGADKIIDPIAGDWHKMKDAVLAAYTAKYGDQGYFRMDETAKLVYILRKEGETYDGTKL